MTYRYRLKLEPDDNGTILVTSPDFPPLATFGDDEAEARRQALDALLALIASMIEAGDVVPPPCRLGTGAFVRLPLLVSLKVELHNAMLEAGVNREELRKRAGLPDGAVDRLLRLSHDSRIQDVETAFRAIGREISVEATPNVLIA